MIASLGVRGAPSRRARARPRPAAARRARRGSPSALGAGPRLFALCAGVLGAAFLVALLYLRSATSIAAGGYDLQALESRRDELRRENQLLELRAHRLDSPARIEAAAQQLGLRKAARTLLLTAGPTVTRR
jgi:hypothetical protein